ncbi:MAG TPA: class III extradiol ring-cleavage dioxygenase [Pinirhizobacter sp.]|uniref:DODA-type extradiol aromatic ring-opening family dioxygenase n=1 Tax=Pinirhizobacter sp. TaxID=2950432 RepID=UPI002B76720A|nr:class III extradiol ring-cleavage dioxygenase [Pinirhizobacter sp.]HMH69638.1 class III extradiol ring-cleavage dioxygenase [Pinirhizobacter sp.]
MRATSVPIDARATYIGCMDTNLTHSAPAFFISHGAPTFALQPGQLGPVLTAAGGRMGAAKAVLIVSPHWITRGVRVASTPAPDTIHDFGGFPEPLYRLSYRAPGAPDWAARAVQLLESAGFAAEPDAGRGLDHGAWVPLRYLLPEANTPVFQVSMPRDFDTAGAWRMGRALAPLRAQGVAIVGSGSLTHNLYEVFHGGKEAPYAQEFASWATRAVLGGDTDALLHYRAQAPSAERAHPTEEHFLPLVVAAGAATEGEQAQLLPGGMTYGVLAMDSYAWGLPLPEAA